MSRVGFVVNPIAGIGGRVGHKGSDDPDRRAEAIALGATPPALERARVTAALLGGLESIEHLSWGGAMGEAFLLEQAIEPLILGRPGDAVTTSADTKAAALAMTQAGVDLLLFVGGDGTARDIQESIGETVPVIGVPAGVKMFSGVFAAHPRGAVMLARRFLAAGAGLTMPSPVLDRDGEDPRERLVATRLHGYLQVPREVSSTLGMKSPSPRSDVAAMRAIGREIAMELRPETAVVLGPGSTVRAIGEAMGSGSTLLGVDVARNGRLVIEDGNEEEILGFLENDHADRIVVSPIGGQGFVLGRGNQQISPRVIRAVGLERIEIVVTPGKLQDLQGRPLLVDSGDDELDRDLAGWRKLRVGPGEQAVYNVVAAADYVPEPDPSDRAPSATQRRGETLEHE